MRRKILSIMIILCLSLFVFPLPAPAASDFTDMPDGAYGQALQKAVGNGLLVGEGKQIMPAAPLTRGQMAAIISRAFGACEKGDISAFSDVSADAWYYAPMQTAYQMGAFKGDGSKLLPKGYISREESFIVIARALKLTPAESMECDFRDAADISSWAKGLVYAMVNAGYVSGDGNTLRPKETITRQDFATVFDNVIKTYVRTSGAIPAVSAGNVMVNTPDAILKDLTIEGDLIVGEGVGNGDVTLDHVTVTGRMVVRGGGENSIHIMNNSQVGSLVISKTDSGNVRVTTEEGCEIAFTYIDDGKDDVILEGNFASVSVEANVPVIAQNAQIGTVTVTAESASIKLEGTSQVSAIDLTKEAKGAVLEVSANAKVTKVTSNAEKASISGSGTVSEAIVSGNDTAINTSGTKITVSEGTSGVSQNGTAIPGGTTPVTQSSTGGGGGGGGGSQTGPRDVSTFTDFKTAMSSASVNSINITADFTVTEDITLSKPVAIATGTALTVAAGAELTADEAGSDTAAGVVNNGTLQVNGSVELGASDMTNAGSVTVGTGGSLRVYMSTLMNNGTVTVAEGGRLELDRGGIFANYNILTNSGTIYIGIEGGSLNINQNAVATNNGLIVVYGFLNGTVTNGGGTIENHVATPTDEASFSAAMNNTAIARIYIDEGRAITLTEGTSFTKKVEIDNGTLTLNADVTISGAKGYLAIDGDDDDTKPDGRVVVSDGKTLTVGAGGSIGVNGELEVGGTLVNDGEIAIDQYGELEVRGSLTNNSDLLIAPNGVLYLEGGSVTNAAGGTLTNDDGHIRLFSSATLTNNGALQQDGVLLVVDVYDENGCAPCSVTGTLINNELHGYIAEINNAGYLTQELYNQNYYTTVNINVNTTLSNDLNITAPTYVNNGAVLTIAPGKTLTVAAGAKLIMEEAGSDTAAGVVNNGTLQVNGSVELGASDMTNGDTGSVNVAANGSFGIYMCILTNGGQFTVETDGTLEMDRGGQFVNNNTLNNRGTVTVTNDGGSLQNNSGAEIANDGTININTGPNGGYYTNNGTFTGNEPNRIS